MTSHPGHAFWVRLMKLVTGKTDGAAGEDEATNNETRRTRLLSDDGQPPLSPTGQQSPDDVFCGGDTAREGECGVADSRHATPPPQSPPPAAARGEATMSLNGSAAELDSRPTLVLPVDHRLADVQDYVRMLTDIGRIYRRKAAGSTGDSRELSCRLSMLYNAYTAVRLQALLTVFRGHFAALNTSGDARAEDMFQIYAQRSMNAQWGSSAGHVGLSRGKSAVGEFDVKAGSRDPSEKGSGVRDSFSGHLCIFWQSMHYLFCINVLSYPSSALRLMHTTVYGVSPATQKAVLEMALRCFELVEQDFSVIAEANSHLFLGGIMKKFVAPLLEFAKECRLRDETPANFGAPRRGMGTQRTVKELEPKFLRLGPANLAEKQQTFLRTAMHFPVMTLPMLDLSTVVEVKLEIQNNGSSRPAKLMTPLNRSYGWYMAFAENNRYERHSEKPGQSKLLQQKCGLPLKATLKDPNVFICAGLEELTAIAGVLAVATANILFAMGKVQGVQTLEKATNQLCLDVYGESSPLSKTFAGLFAQMGKDATC